MSVLKQLESRRKTNLFTSITASLRMFTLENSAAKENPLRKRKSLRPKWPKLSKENKKSSMKKSQKPSRLPLRKTMG